MQESGPTLRAVTASGPTNSGSNRTKSAKQAGHRPTLEEVATRAGVSRATASRVIRGAENVSEEAREAVLNAATELSYTVNRAARSLVTKRSDSVAFLVAETQERMFRDPYFLGILRGAQSVIRPQRPATDLRDRLDTFRDRELRQLRGQRPRRRHPARLPAR